MNKLFLIFLLSLTIFVSGQFKGSDQSMLVTSAGGQRFQDRKSVSRVNNTTLGASTLGTYLRAGHNADFNLLNSQMTSTDYDGDGVPDVSDLDDDNDGILDTAENTSTCQLIQNGTFSTGNSAGATSVVPGWTKFNLTGNGVWNGTYVFNGNDAQPIAWFYQDFVSTPGFSNNIKYEVGRLDGRFGGTVGVRVDIIDVATGTVIATQSHTKTQSSPETTEQINFTPIGNSTRVMFSDISTATVSIDIYIDNVSLISCDTDSDGIPNQYDLDSDGDGCPDAIEGGAAFTGASLQNSSLAGGNSGSGYTGTSTKAVTKNLGNTVGSTGIPTIANSGQTIGTSANGGAKDAACETCPTITNTAGNNVNPSSCGTATGSIKICGLTANASGFTVNYDKNGTPAAALTGQTADASGCITITGLTAGSYTNIMVSNTACPSGSNVLSATLSDPAAPSAPNGLAGAQSSVCIGTSVALSATGTAGATYTWSVAPAGATLSSVAGTVSGTTASNTFNSTASGTYTISLTQTVGGCTSSAATTTITVNAPPSTVVPTATSKSNACPLTTVDLTSLEPAPVSGITYEWHTVASNPTAGDLVATPATAVSGTYFIYAKSTAGCYSSASSPVIATVNACVPCSPVDPGIVSASAASIKAGNTATFTLTGATAGATTTWAIFPSNGVSPNTGTGTSTGLITFNIAGEYQVLFSTTNTSSPAGCNEPNFATASGQFLVEAPLSPCPKPSASSVTVSPSSAAISVGATASFTMTGGTPSSSVQWVIIPSAGVSPSSGTGTSTGSITFANKGLYTAVFSIVNLGDGSCDPVQQSSSAPIAVGLNPCSPPTSMLINSSAANQSSIIGQTVTFTATGGIPGAKTWSVTPATGASPTSGTGNVATITFTEGGTYTVVFTSKNSNIPLGCTQPVNTSASVMHNVVIDTDGDGVPDVTDLDDDNDGMLDTVEQAACSPSSLTCDTDGDGIINSLDLDSDNDGINDVIEAGLPDTDGNGLADGAISPTTGVIANPVSSLPVLNDKDADGKKDPYDPLNGTTPAGISAGLPASLFNPSTGQVICSSNCDPDKDGILTPVDAIPNTWGDALDTDGDNIPDITDLDDDNDGILDTLEDATSCTNASGVTTTNADCDGDGIPNRLDLDSDNDGINDVIEAGGTDADGNGNADGAVGPTGIPASAGSGLTPPNTDGQGGANPYDLDSDNDNISDLSEGGLPSSLDADNDGKVDCTTNCDPDKDGILTPVDAIPNTWGDGLLPDLSPTTEIASLEFLAAGTQRDFVINVFEINNVANVAGKPIAFRITKLSAFDITYTTTSGVSNVFSAINNSNSDWTFTENANFITVTAKSGITIPAGGSKIVGFKATRKTGIPHNTSQNITVTIIFGSAGEEKVDNNIVETKITAN